MSSRWNRENTSLLDWTDRNTCVLFGDGAGVMIVASKHQEFYQAQ